MAEKKTAVKKAAKKEVKSTKKVEKKEVKKVEKKETKKVATKKVSKPKVAKVEEVKVEEVKPLQVQEVKEQVKAEIKEEVKTCKNDECFFKKHKALIPIIIVVIAVIGLLLFFGNGKKTYALNETNEMYTGEMSVTLPHNWYQSNDCSLYVKDGNYLKFKGAIYAEDYDEAYYNEMIAYYNEYYDLEDVEFDTLTGRKLSSQEEDISYNYYFLKNDTSIVIIMLQDTDDTTTASIINTIK